MITEAITVSWPFEQIASTHSRALNRALAIALLTTGGHLFEKNNALLIVVLATLQEGPDVAFHSGISLTLLLLLHF